MIRCAIKRTFNIKEVDRRTLSFLYGLTVCLGSIARRVHSERIIFPIAYPYYLFEFRSAAYVYWRIYKPLFGGGCHNNEIILKRQYYRTPVFIRFV